LAWQGTVNASFAQQLVAQCAAATAMNATRLDACVSGPANEWVKYVQ
jgi:hypothetical protein